ncbi:MAG: iron-containing alcohol dehydrogenase [Gemmobacter sp.]
MSLITYLTRVHFADRVLEDALPEEMSRLRLRRVLVATDAAGEVEDHYDRLVDALPAGAAAVPMRGVRAPLRPQAVHHASEAVEQLGCDGVVGLGGAAALDLARLAGGGRRPVIVVPTTTASVGLGPVALAPKGCQALPAVVLCDPTLTLGAPVDATAAAAMDALTHCIEAYLGTAWNPPADGIAIEGVRRAGGHIERAVRDGQDLVARRELLAAALCAGLAAQKGLGGVHALAHALEAEPGLSARHGSLHAALLPPVLEFNAPAVADRFTALHQALALDRGTDLPQAIAALGARLALPVRLGHLGLDACALDRIAARAAEDPANRTNPRLAGAADYRRLLEAAL